MAHQVIKHRFLIALMALGALRLAAGALLPLSADEAYYWLWSRHLAAGYFDHPPAIAWVIRTGTAVCGQTAFGVRIGGILLSFAATWLIWRSTVLLLAEKRTAWLAALLFNLTLMTTVESLAATPDAPQMFTAAAMVWALAELTASGNGRWWLAVGAAAGFGLLAKYSTLFFGVGIVVWLLACPAQRRWLVSPWPYLGGLIALGLFAPNLAWNADHGWATFGFQFGRIAGNHITLKYLGEFVGAQALLASPFILVLGVVGLCAARRTDPKSALLASLFWPSLAYFAVHALHDRVQGNWPCYLYPVLAMAAADAFRRSDWTAWRRPLARWSARFAIPVAAVLLVAGYAQALIGVVPMGRKDPLARLLAVGMPEVTAEIEALRQANGAGAVLTTDYATTALLAFYGPFPVGDLGEDYRWADIAPTRPNGPVLYVVEDRHDRADLVHTAFAEVHEIAHLRKMRQSIPIATYVVYRASGPGAATIRIP